MGIAGLTAIQTEFELFCEELTLAELLGNPEVWAAIRRIEELLA